MNLSRGYQYLSLCLCLAIYSQIVMKWQITRIGSSPTEPAEIVAYAWRLLMNPWIISGAIATFFAGVAWLLAIGKLELSHAYPFISITFVVMLAASAVLFHEPVTWQKVAGSVLIVAGIILSSQG